MRFFYRLSEFDASPINGRRVSVWTPTHCAPPRLLPHPDTVQTPSRHRPDTVQTGRLMTSELPL
eukprot:4012629-Pyramimonas_sp.AAC.1